MGTFFERMTLRALGLHFQLGHLVRVSCCNPEQACDNDFVSIDTNGIHSVAVNFCDCETVQPHAIQLLRSHWYPATTTDPKLAATFCVLDHFQMYTFKLKGFTFEYYHALACLTNNTGVKTPKHSGCGHSPSGVHATKEGELAVLCLDCPHSGKNLLPNWREALLTDDTENFARYLYSLFLGIDGNFWMCWQDKSSEAADPSLSKGWAYFMEESKYKNMNYFFFQSMQHAGDVSVLIILYNIAYYWSKHLWQCMKELPVYIKFLVPKFHLLAHIGLCQTKYLFNFHKAPKHGWANINPVATSMREMGPGNRHDMLDDHFSNWNWKKVCALGTTLQQKLKEEEAIPKRDQHMLDLAEFEKAIPPANLNKWRHSVENWEADDSKPNPFEVKASTITAVSVWLELAQSNAADLKQGVDISLHPNMSPSNLIVIGIELEGLQYGTFEGKLGPHATDTQHGHLQQHTNALQCWIKQWAKVQILYMPLMSKLRVEVGDSTSSEDQQDVSTLQLCKALNQLCQQLWLKSHLVTFKKEWITGQCANTRPQGLIKAIQAKVDAATEQYHTAHVGLKFLAVPLAKLEWEEEFPVLRQEDIRCMMEGLESISKISKGRRLLSTPWIWKTSHGVQSKETRGEDSDKLHDVMCIEWCKARAHAGQWKEVELLQEEMRHTLAFLIWHADWWIGKAGQRPDVSISEAEGLLAYV
ncbi:hypothetical protein PAXRUDRAFT_36671 [Paxillus rubicundulus Ve08.2h10]|uniref:CxC2-like cysteine cluster KDZ transposase-associated domain-containing protein n=1 Tax=Paxillus rubicundulus Ve08.2h10 TaxID=930991 RepID=A0A0D0DC68_9AGAM|nr:hypothetical protein PAXRUDRAFT_36671 [Paxillus rubicundulus Ve08.2h10]